MMQSFRKPLRCICSCKFVRLLMYCVYIFMFSEVWVSHVSGFHPQVDVGKYDGQARPAIVFSHIVIDTNNSTN
jgi:hypothetical protein